jgi:serine/threonine-protein kinase
MNQQDTPRNLGPADATLDDPHLYGDGSTRLPAVAPHVNLVQGGQCKGLSSETESLLHTRLRVAASVLFAGFLVFLVWSVGHVLAGKPMVGPVLIGEVIVTAVLGMCAGILLRRCPPSAGLLRISELAIFGLPALFFLLVQYYQMKTDAELRGLFADPSSPWLLLIFTYALFIPNTWQRAAMVLTPMALAPLLLTGFLSQMDAHCQHCIGADSESVIRLILVMLIALGTAVVAVKTIGTLRRAVFEAQQLGQYKLGARIGAGGMGEVFLAEHELLKRPCAIKLIRPEKAGDPKVLLRFEREVRATAKLSHWNSVDIYDYGHARCGTFYYVMEYLPGMNLDDLVAQHGPMSAARLIYLLRQACDALAEAHRAGIVHRDIKPANIFAAERGGLHDVAKLLDFGLAKPFSDQDAIHVTQEGAITGSPHFMSPEQVMAERDLDGRSDIYSMGAVAYYLLTGEPPFNETKTMKVLFAHTNREPPPPSQLNAGVPSDVEQVVLRCLAKNPDDRYQTAEELMAALDQCADAGRWTRTDADAWWRGRAASTDEPAALVSGQTNNRV